MTVLECIASATLKTIACGASGTAGFSANTALEVVPDAAVVETANYTGRRVEKRQSRNTKTRPYLLLVVRQD